MLHIIKHDPSHTQLNGHQSPSEHPVTKHHFHLMHAISFLASVMKELFSSSSSKEKDASNSGSIVEGFEHLVGPKGELKTLLLDIKNHKEAEILKDIKDIKNTFNSLEADFKQILASLVDVDQSGELVGLVPNLLSVVADLNKGDLKNSFLHLTEMKAELNEVLKILLGDLVEPSTKTYKIINSVEDILHHLTMIGEGIYVVVKDAQSPVNTEMILKDIYDLTGNINGVLQDVNSCLKVRNQKLKAVTSIIDNVHKLVYQLYANPDAPVGIQEDISNMKQKLHDLFLEPPTSS